MTTLDWYNANAQTFVDGADLVDLSALRGAFLEHLPRGARVLDVGSGSGRDACAFEALGHRVTALEPSTALAARLRERLRGEVIPATVESLEVVDAFDGVWACASLLHVPAVATRDALTRLRRALVAGGVLYASYKRGDGERWESGRFFNDQTRASIEGLLTEVGFERARTWETRDARPDRADTVWVNALAWRPSTLPPLS